MASGEALLSPVATRSLITRFLMSPASGPGLAPPERLADLTVREREVMALAAEGRSNTEIAEDLTLSPLTVRTHIHRAMTKLHARDRAQLVVIAYQTGLVPPHAAGDVRWRPHGLPKVATMRTSTVLFMSWPLASVELTL